jgi:hypothetical protein
MGLPERGVVAISATTGEGMVSVDALQLLAWAVQQGSRMGMVSEEAVHAYHLAQQLLPWGV